MSKVTTTYNPRTHKPNIGKYHKANQSLYYKDTPDERYINVILEQTGYRPVEFNTLL